MMLRKFTVLVLFLLLLWSSVALSAEARGIKLHVERLALVIGNSAYQTSPLKNPTNDAEDRGYLKEAKGCLLKGAELSERINMFYLAGSAHFCLANTYFDREEYNISQQHYERSIFNFQQAGLTPSWVLLSRVAIIRTKIMSNEKNISLDELFKCHVEIKSKQEKSTGLYYLSDILLNIDDRSISEAEDWIKKAIQSHKQYGMMWHLARDYALYAEFFKRKKEFPKAKENLGRAMEIAQKCGADGWVEKYEKELAGL